MINSVDSESRRERPLREKWLIRMPAFVLRAVSLVIFLRYWLNRAGSLICNSLEKIFWCIWYFILRLTIGYGYKPFRSLWLALGLPLIGAILFNPCPHMFSSKFTSFGCVPAFLENEWIPSDGEALKHWGQKGRAPQGYPNFQPFIYSLESVFPVLPLGQLDKWHPSNPVLQWVSWVWTFVGSVLLAILALFGVGVLGPNWKSEGDGG